MSSVRKTKSFLFIGENSYILPTISPNAAPNIISLFSLYIVQHYKKVKELLENGGIQAVIDNDEFDISGGGTIADWVCNGYVPIYACGYNATIYINDKNFDTDNKKNEWYVSGEVDIYSYGGGDDTIYINNNISITDRIMGLVDYARKNGYTLDDLYKEYDSLKNVLDLIAKEDENEK